jgi:DNA-binding helix-hairpin-helix protein with protein kinase domain
MLVITAGPTAWPARQALIVEWRRNVEATFVFKTAGAIQPHEMQAVAAKYERLELDIQDKVIAVEQQLRRIAQDSEKQLRPLAHKINACMAQLAQAEADVSVIPKGL